MSGASEAADLFWPPASALLQWLGLPAAPPAETEVTVPGRGLRRVMDAYVARLPFDAEFYLATYPDLAAACAAGTISDPHRHFVTRGFWEDRMPVAPAFYPEFYTQHYPDMAALRAAEGDAALAAHFFRYGRWEGRLGHPLQQAKQAEWGIVPVNRTMPLAHRSVAQALVRAFREPVIAPPPLGFRGGPELGAHAMDDFLRHRRHGAPVDSGVTDAPVRDTLAGEYVYAGPSHNHFGHVMSETLHRILPARRFFDCRQVLVVAGHQGAPPAGFGLLSAVQQQALRFLGVAPREVTVLRDDRIVETLHVAQQGAELGSAPRPDYLEMLAAYTGPRLDELADTTPMPARVYVSRSRIRTHGVLLGETYLERQLAMEGWHIFHPETVDLVTQMQMYYRAEAIIFAGGSSCHGTELFGTRQLKRCFVLPRGHTPADYYRTLLGPRCAAYATLPEAPLIGSAVRHADDNAVQPQWGVSMLVMPLLRAALRSHGLAQLPYFRNDVYRQQALADFETYLHEVRTQESAMIRIRDEPELRALAQDVLALLS